MTHVSLSKLYTDQHAEDATPIHANDPVAELINSRPGRERLDAFLRQANPMAVHRLLSCLTCLGDVGNICIWSTHSEATARTVAELPIDTLLELAQGDDARAEAILRCMPTGLMTPELAGKIVRSPNPYVVAALIRHFTPRPYRIGQEDIAHMLSDDILPHIADSIMQHMYEDDFTEDQIHRLWAALPNADAYQYTIEHGFFKPTPERLRWMMDVQGEDESGQPYIDAIYFALLERDVERNYSVGLTRQAVDEIYTAISGPNGERHGATYDILWMLSLHREFQLTPERIDWVFEKPGERAGALAEALEIRKDFTLTPFQIKRIQRGDKHFTGLRNALPQYRANRGL
ncbi:hypothetical protein [Acidihalobacter aeolianus]|nr:hypothetical protein [Acidihalobacter aeolianus]